ncbi:TPA: hypothetical protein N0F65_005741 [Lagenidium giganteum]|uniref:Integrase zinc-binding domain-containing protein n=1 Tax=Lagenidium giganteum TaxID=4803 RepID=A0AAV2YU61_9STRA|nr:TPA: hypothetical protein N0F65_005741 [Lagenidium giganteum]
MHTYSRVREWFYWPPGQYRSVHDFVSGCIDCQTRKGAPRERHRSPGNIPATYSFQMLGMDHIPSLPGSFCPLKTALQSIVFHRLSYLSKELDHTFMDVSFASSSLSSSS